MDIRWHWWLPGSSKSQDWLWVLLHRQNSVWTRFWHLSRQAFYGLTRTKGCKEPHSLAGTLSPLKVGNRKSPKRSWEELPCWHHMSSSRWAHHPHRLVTASWQCGFRTGSTNQRPDCNVLMKFQEHMHTWDGSFPGSQLTELTFGEKDGSWQRQREAGWSSALLSDPQILTQNLWWGIRFTF